MFLEYVAHPLSKNNPVEHSVHAPSSILTGAGSVIDSKAVYLTGVGANFESEAKNFFVILFLGSLTLVY